MYELIVVGGGPAGVSAALYARSRGLHVLVLEADQIGGLIGRVSKVSHFASAIDEETGPAFAARLQAQLDTAGIQVAKARVTKVEKTAEGYRLLASVQGHCPICGGEEEQVFEAKKVILACGSTPKELPVEAGFAHWALGAEERVKDKVVVINGGSDGAAKEALYLAQFAHEVHMIQDQPALLCIPEFKNPILANDRIHVHTGTTLAEVVRAGEKIVAVKLQGGTCPEIRSEGGLEIFVCIGQSGNGAIAEGLLPLEGGFVKLPGVETEHPGLFVAGDLRVKAVRQVATAVADGCLAGIAAAK